MGHRSFGVLLAVWIGVGAGCSFDGSDPVALPPLGAPFDCSDPIGVLDEPDGFVVLGDVVAFPPSDLVLQRGREVNGRRFSKFGLLVRTNRAFQIHVGPDSQDNAQIRWDNVGGGGPAGSLSIPGCDGDGESTGDQWLAYPGGVWTLEEACVELIVLTPEGADSTELSIGIAC